MLIFDEYLLPCCTLAWEERSPACPCSYPWWPWHQAKDPSLSGFIHGYLIRQNSTSLNKLPLNVLTEWTVMTTIFYANIVSFIQCHDNASRGSEGFILMIFMKTSKEKVNYNKVKHFCRRLEKMEQNTIENAASLWLWSLQLISQADKKMDTPKPNLKACCSLILNTATIF